MLKKLFRYSSIVWLASIFLFLLIVAINYILVFKFKINNGFIAPILLIVVGLGVFAFLLIILSFVLISFQKDEVNKNPSTKRSKKQNFFLLLKFLIVVGIFPIYGLWNILKPVVFIKKLKSEGVRKTFNPKTYGFKKVISNIFATLFLLFICFPIWVGGYVLFIVIVGNQLGYLEQPINIVGTGSMYPTFPKGTTKTPKERAKEIMGTQGMLPYPNGLSINGKRFGGHEIGRGDIVVVENQKTREATQKLYGNPSGWLKRVIAIAGDTLELKGGIVYLNNQPLKESYTAKARSTFGETFLPECQKITVPTNSIFVMGDNRKGSGDSREVGFFDLKSVNHVLPLVSQKGILDKNWRDTSKDFANSSKIKIDKNKYLELLNEKRKEAGAQILKYQPKLELSAGKRGETIIKYNDFSWEATRSGYTMASAMFDAGYYNITYGE